MSDRYSQENPLPSKGGYSQPPSYDTQRASYLQEDLPRAPPPQGYPQAPPQDYPQAAPPQGYPQGYQEYPQQQYPYDQPPPQYQPNPYPGQGTPSYPQDRPPVVIIQPSVVTTEHVTQAPSRIEFGIAATVFAAISLIFLCFFLCWWSLPCAIIGIVLGVTSSSAGSNGDVSTAKTHASVSVGCSVCGILSAFGGIGLSIGITYALTSSN